MKFWRNYSWPVLLAAWMLASCDTATLPSEVFDIQGQWELQAFEMANGNTVVVPHPEKFTLVFDSDGKVHLTVDCNSCFGSYEVQGNNLTFGLLGCTLAYCGDDSLDGDYVAAIETTSSYARSGNELRLNYEGGTLRFRVSS